MYTFLWALRPSPFGVKWTWMVRPFRPERDLQMQWSQAFTLVYEVTLMWGFSNGSRYDANSNKPWTIIHNMPCNNPCTLFFGPLHLHLLVWSELGWFGIFDQREILKCNGHMPSVSCTKWPLVRWNFSNENRFDANSNRPWNIVHNLPCNNPYRLFFGPLGLLPFWCEVNLDGSAFPTNERSSNATVTGLQSCVWSDPWDWGVVSSNPMASMRQVV